MVEYIAMDGEAIGDLIEMTSRMAAAKLTGWRRAGDELGRDELTEAIRPVAEAAATVRLDCRKAFLNIVMGVQRSGRVVSLKERCNWGEERRGERGLWMDGRRALSSGLGGFSELH